jgi:hypothetical protein
MNKERIKELVDQAKNSVPAGLEPMEWINIHHEKFAELLLADAQAEIFKLKQEILGLQDLLINK